MLQSRQADQPIDIETQLEEIWKSFRTHQSNQIIFEEDLQLVQDFKSRCCFSIEPYDKRSILQAEKLIPEKLRQRLE